MDQLLKRGNIGDGGRQVSPWRNMFMWILDNVDPIFLDNMMYFLQENIGQEYEDYVEEEMDVDDERKYFSLLDNLENTRTEDQIASLLEKVLNYLQLHHDTGERFSDILQAFRKQVDDYWLSRKKDEEEIFVGREKELIDIKENLLDEKIRVVCICGFGGNGKSSLARKVCYQMHTCADEWKIIKVNLKEKSSLLDILRCILTENGQLIDGQDVDTIRKQICGLLESIQNRTIWLLDDADSIMTSQREMNIFMNFLTGLVLEIDNTRPECMLKLLITTRQKISPQLRKGNQLHQKMFEIEVSSLDHDTAEELFRKSTDNCEVEEEKLDSVLEQCCYSPLAISVVSGMIKSKRFTPNQLEFHLKYDKRNVTEGTGVRHCIHQTVTSLDPELQECLLKLSVFRTGPFTIEAAVAVLSHPQGNKGVFIDKAQEQLRNLCGRHLLQAEDLNLMRNKNKSRVEYTLHPVVYKYLSEWINLQANSARFQACLSGAVHGFVLHMESVAERLGKLFDSKCMKALKELEENRSNLLVYYGILEKKPEQLPPYSAPTLKATDVLKKKRISDLTDLLLGQQRLTIFKSEAERALQSGNQVMHIFWRVEYADMLIADSRPEIGFEVLSELETSYFSPKQRSSFSQYPFLVRALYHKARGQSHRKMRQLTLAQDELEKASTIFIDELGESVIDGEKAEKTRKYCGVFSKVLRDLGTVYFESRDLDKAQEMFDKAQNVVYSLIAKGPDSDNRTAYHLELPAFFTLCGSVQFQKGLLQKNDNERQNYFKNAMDFYTRALDLDCKLKLENLDGHSQTQKNLADVLIAIGREDELHRARKLAEKAKERRYDRLGPATLATAESEHQEAKIYLKLGHLELKKGNKEMAGRCWRASQDRFKILLNHQLKYGEVLPQNPLYREIKKDMEEVVTLINEKKFKDKVEAFYKEFETAQYQNYVKESRRDKLEEKMTQEEFFALMFGEGGSSFGEANIPVLVKREQVLVSDDGDAGKEHTGVGGKGPVPERQASLNNNMKDLALEPKEADDNGNQSMSHPSQRKRSKASETDS